MADKVYLKKSVASDKPFESHPNATFGIIIAILSVSIVASLFLSSVIPIFLIAVIDIAIIAGTIFWILKKNEKSNLSASDAFIKRDGRLYHVRLGYNLENEVPISGTNVVLGGPKFAMDAARAEENTYKSAIVKDLRKNEEALSCFLDEILLSKESGPVRLPEYVIEFEEMINPRLEKQDRDWIWVSFEGEFTAKKRTTRKFRNAFDLEMLN